MNGSMNTHMGNIEIDNEVILYNYDVPNEQLFKFIKTFENNTLNGTIIEIDKYFPEGLA